MADRALPTRVVDVGTEESLLYPFVWTTNGAIGQWVTLSHCWGGVVPLTTTSLTLSQHQKIIRTEDLPPTFRDAISLTRKLGFRIDFGSSKLHWYCRSTQWTEGFEASTTSSISGKSEAKGLYDFPLCTESLDRPPEGVALTVNHPLYWWYNHLRSYVRRSITTHTDILPAIAGIAEKIAERTGYRYQAGLWLEDMHRGLLWQAWGSSKRSMTAACPSWSWGSSILPWERNRHFYLDSYEELDNRATIINVSVINAGDSVFGEVLSGTLTLRGHCRSFRDWDVGSQLLFNTVYGKYKYAQIRHRFVNTADHEADRPEVPPIGKMICTLDERPFYEDTCYEEMVTENIICMQIAKFGHWNGVGGKLQGTTTFALILLPTNTKDEEYIRIGIAEIPDENGMADGWETRTVTIV
ncbi:hypothetical protein EG329_000858 [Mollisiaceae sp. DMI_Dod_QoI]|nr:hypothetical protein EG329_000858 [Helotiales sp. DMI_Dod_QoI]